MLPNTLVTNEVKNASGVEVEFTRLSTGDRTSEFAKTAENPANPHRLKISHLESGTGTSRRRRSVVRFDYTINGQVDSAKVATTSAYVVLDAPVGNIVNNAPLQMVLANIMSLVASTGATTTILFDGTGYGATALINGDL